MPSTHLSLNFHLIFSTKNRETLIEPRWRDQLHTYMGGTINGLGGVAVGVGGVSDHVHLLIGLRATHAIADVLRELKSESSRWVHETIRERGFAWQEGYAAITVNPSHLEGVRRYVLNQEEHHRTKTFQEEYRELLEKAGIAYDENTSGDAGRFSRSCRSADVDHRKTGGSATLHAPAKLSRPSGSP